jgi:2-polyprenyl-3-methyl-5-hydroxy-6-metoxy-1,4-benzoquinol methylase
MLDNANLNRAMAASAGGSSEKIHARAAEALDKQISKDTPIVDLGAGVGTFAQLLLNQGFQSVEVCDGFFSPEGSSKNIRFTKANLNTALPFPDASFGAVTALEVIEHLENPRAFVKEIVRILKPGGFAIVSTPNLESITSLTSLIFRGYPSAFAPSCYPAHITPLLEIDLRRIFKENGLVNTKTFFTNEGRMPSTDLSWSKLLGPLARGRRFSDNYLLTAKKEPL